MGAFLKFLNAESIYFQSINYYKDADWPISSGDRYSNDFCINKNPGTLRFMLNSVKHFGETNFDFNVIFTGAAAGVDSAGNDQVMWSFALDFSSHGVSNNYPYKGFNVSIDKIQGYLLTSLIERPIDSQPVCSGASGLSTVTITTPSFASNLIEIKANALSVDYWIKMRNIQIAADSRYTTYTDAKLKVITDECGIKQDSFVVVVSGVPLNSTVSYVWTVGGGAIPGPNQNYSFHIKIPTGLGGPFLVTVQITIKDTATGSIIFSKTLKANYFPETDQTFKVKSLVCKMYKYLSVNFRFNPLWDPLRDLVTRPINLKDIKRIEAYSKALLREIAAIKKEMEKG